MAKPTVELHIPKDLGLTRQQISDLTKSFQKQLVDTLKAKKVAATAKRSPIIVDVLAKSKTQIV